MASFTFSAGHPYPDGATVLAFAQNGQQPGNYVPPGDPDGSAVVVAGGGLTIADLEAGMAYWAVGRDAGSVERWVGFTVPGVSYGLPDFAVKAYWPLSLREAGVFFDGSAQSSALQALIDQAATEGRVLDTGFAGPDPAAAIGLDAPLTFPDHLVWEGRRVTLRALPGLDASMAVNADQVNGNSNIHLRQLRLDGNLANRGGENGHGLWFRGGDGLPCRRCSFEDLEVFGVPELGVPMQNVQDSEWVRGEIHGCGRDGLTFYWNCQRWRVLKPYIHDCGDDLIGINAEDQSSTGHVLKVIEIVAPILIGQTANGSGISIRGASDIAVLKPYIEAALAAGITISNWNTSPAQHIDVIDPRIVDAGANNSGAAGHGIEFQIGSSTTSLAGVAGIDDVSIVGIRMRNPRAQGVVYTRGPAATATEKLTNLELEGRVKCGSLYTGGYGLVSSNGYLEDAQIDLRVDDAQQAGIQISAGTPGLNKRIRLRKGYARNCRLNAAGPGIFLNSIDRLWMSGYDASGAQHTYGLTVSDITGPGSVHDNDFTGNPSGGINRGAVDADTHFRNNEGENVQARGSAAPTTGTWKQGDIVWSTVGAAAGKAGWYCTAGGSPGTWKPFAAIDP